MQCVVTECCGMAKLYNLSSRTYYHDDSNTTRTARSAGDAMRILVEQQARLAIYATTTHRNRTAPKHLRALGFEALRTWRNPNTGNRLTLWFRMPGPVPEPPA